MARVTVLGPRRLLPDVLDLLQQRGVLELRHEPLGLEALGASKEPLRADLRAREARLAAIEKSTNDALALLPVGEAARRERGAQIVAAPSAEIEAWIAKGRQRIEAASERHKRLEEEQASLLRLAHLFEALSPLVSALGELESVETVGILTKHDPELEATLDLELGAITGGAHTVLSREAGDDERALLVLVPREHAAKVSDRLARLGLTEVRAGAGKDEPTFAGSLRWLLERSQKLPREKAESDVELAGLRRELGPALLAVHRDAVQRLSRLRSLARCGETRHLFVLSGFTPAKRASELARVLAESTAGTVLSTAVPIGRGEEEEEEVPVLLENPRFVRPFELLLGLLPAPRYGSVDPTVLLAATFPLLYGLMLGDAGYGAIVFALAVFVRARSIGGQRGRDAAFIGICCAIASVVFGILFGEYFGDLGHAFGLRPLLMTRAEPKALLVLVLGVGVVHVAIGVALRLWTSTRRRNVRAIATSAMKLALLAAASVAGLAELGHVSDPLGRIAVAVLALVSGTLLFVEGLLSPLEIVKTLGNVLSYARLMAIGLASVMLAEVANRMTVVLRPLALGIVMAVLLHVVNLALGILGPAIQATRLHLVEFFDKFYEPGGSRYRPLSSEPS